MATPLPDVLPMSPYLRPMVWGGRRLQQLYDKPLPPDRAIGESFEVSAYPERESAVAAGPLVGWDLSAVFDEYRSELVGPGVWERSGGVFPLLIKLLDAGAALSIQVHPDDAYVERKGLGQRGKFEAWYVLHSEGGQMVHGLKDGVTEPDFAAAVEQGRVEEVLRYTEISAGDVAIVPPGTVHALGSGALLYEVQQSSDHTFRIHDYGRLGPDGVPRELHLDAAQDVITFGGQAAPPVPWHRFAGARPDGAVLVDSEFFTLSYHCPQASPTGHQAGASLAALTMVAGEAEVAGPRDGCDLRAGDTVLVPANREFSVRRRGAAAIEYLIAAAV